MRSRNHCWHGKEVCIFSLSYPARKANTPHYSHLQPVWLYHILLYYFINDTIFEQIKLRNIEHVCFDFLYNSLGVSTPLCILELSRLTRVEYGSQKHNFICNRQGVSVYTNVSANYMFRPLLVRPSSGWIPWSEEICNNAI